jgi:hypothetical protein
MKKNANTPPYLQFQSSQIESSGPEAVSKEKK